MMAKKTQIMIIAIATVSLVVLTALVLMILYITTDFLKPKDTLFAKYILQNLNVIDILQSQENANVEEQLEKGKYTSQIQGDIEYTENIGTSSESQRNPINNVGIKVVSNVNKSENYNYKNVSIGTSEEDLIRLEYMDEDDKYGVRLDGIQQFVSVPENESGDLEKKIGIDNVKSISSIISNINITSLVDFTENEKSSLQEKYIQIIKNNVPKDKYYKQSNAQITVNNKDYNTNAYSIRFTIEEYNNLYIKILEEIENDDIILSKVDMIENNIKQKYVDYDSSTSLREKFIKYIKQEVEEIQNNNIGKDEVKITVYESKGKTVRTTIEKNVEKLTIDLYDTVIKIDKSELGENTNEQSIKIENSGDLNNRNVILKYDNIQNDQIISDIQLDYKQSSQDNKLDKIVKLEIANEKYSAVFNVTNNTEFVEEFEEKISFDEDNNIVLNDLANDKMQLIISVLAENFQGQIEQLSNVVEVENYNEMLGNLNLINNTSVTLPEEGTVTEVEKRRFNAAYEFFVGENLTKENIDELIQNCTNDLEDVKVLLKNGTIENLNIEKLESYEDETEYIESISEIIIFIKEKSNNKDRAEEATGFFENSNETYTVSLQYDDNGLVRIIRIKIEEDA